MTDDKHLQTHLELCKRVYLRMLQDGSWPWVDSPNSDDVVESEDTANDV